MRQGVESLNPLLIISRFLFNHFKLLLIRKPCPSIVCFVAFFFRCCVLILRFVLLSNMVDMFKNVGIKTSIYWRFLLFFFGLNLDPAN